MARYNNRTMARASSMLECGLRDPNDAIRLAAIMETIDQEQATHRKKRDRLLKRLRVEIERIERKEDGR